MMWWGASERNCLLGYDLLMRSSLIFDAGAASVSPAIAFRKVSLWCAFEQKTLVDPPAELAVRDCGMPSCDGLHFR